jgi:hypothetical protein
VEAMKARLPFNGSQWARLRFIVRGVSVNKEFQITYEVKGIQVVKVTLPEGTDVPANWNSLSIQEQDEWLYEHEIKTEKYYEDIHYSLPASILEIRHLKAVI